MKLLLENWRKKIINEQANETNELYSSIAYIYVRWCERSVEEEVSKKKDRRRRNHTHATHSYRVYLYIHRLHTLNQKKRKTKKKKNVVRWRTHGKIKVAKHLHTHSFSSLSHFIFSGMCVRACACECATHSMTVSVLQVNLPWVNEPASEWMSVWVYIFIFISAWDLFLFPLYIWL